MEAINWFVVCGFGGKPAENAHLTSSALAWAKEPTICCTFKGIMLAIGAHFNLQAGRKGRQAGSTAATPGQ